MSTGDDLPGKASILVVDDLPEKLLVMRTVLDELGQELVLVRSGGEALREVLNREFAVILLDVNMPDIDGFETASLIRRYKRSAHTPIIFITAYADEIQAAQGYSLGAVDYILSPVVPDVLRSKVKVFVELYDMQRRVRRQSDERLALVAAEAARRVAEENTRRSAFLSQASRVLSGSLDLGVATGRLLELVVPAMAPHAMLALPEGELGQAVLERCDAAADGSSRRGTRRFADLAPALRTALERCIASGRRVVLGADALAADVDGADGGAVVPLALGTRTLGALLAAAAEPLEIDTLEELAERAAIALENARLYRSLQAEIVERRQAEHKLQQANRRKDEFLAMLSHELRNPLAPIRNSIEVIRRVGPLDPKLAWANEVMDRQVQQMTRLVEELLDVARISQGKIALQMEPVDLHAVIEHSVETVRPFVESRRQALVLQLPEHAVWLRGDFARLSQVVANLLNNACKYTEEGGLIQVTLGVDGGDAVISVRDNGIGIDAELLPQVFELFEQGKRALDRAQGGLGVGLTLVRRLVELHHGSVEAISDGPGQGAEFRVRLPCLVELGAGEATPGAPEREAAAGCRVLVVDDNTDAADSVAMFLGMVGHEVKTVADGHAALACVAVYAPQVVVLDIGLPGLDGFEVARRMRRLPETARAFLVAVTGYGSKSDHAKALEAGFDHHFVKPADPGQLADAIARWLAGGSAPAAQRLQGGS